MNIDGGTITASTALGTGDAGNITIHAGQLALAHEGNIQVGTKGIGKGGSLQLAAGRITIDGSGPAVFKTGISSQAEGEGNGGDIRLAAGDLELRGGGIISAKSTGAGKAGTLSLDIGGALSLTDSSILTNAELSAGGNIDLKIGGRLLMLHSTITSSANGVTATDNGGNLTMSRPGFLVINRGSILARANAGNGGNITLGADFFLQSADSTINASSNRGLDGRIVIDSPHQVTGKVNVLEAPRLDISELLRERCAAAAFEERSSFTVEAWSGLPLQPGDFLSTPLMPFPSGGGAGGGGGGAPARGTRRSSFLCSGANP
jgi:large exoprotein involved in heme utilization and adhesion